MSRDSEGSLLSEISGLLTLLFCPLTLRLSPIPRLPFGGILSAFLPFSHALCFSAPHQLTFSLQIISQLKMSIKSIASKIIKPSINRINAYHLSPLTIHQRYYASSHGSHHHNHSSSSRNSGATDEELMILDKREPPVGNVQVDKRVLTENEFLAGTGRLELLKKLAGVKDRLYLERPYEEERRKGTVQDPLMVPTIGGDRIVGCTGGRIPYAPGTQQAMAGVEMDEEHELLWQRVAVGEQGRCVECGNVFQVYDYEQLSQEADQLVELAESAGMEMPLGRESVLAMWEQVGPSTQGGSIRPGQSVAVEAEAEWKRLISAVIEHVGPRYADLLEQQRLTGSLANEEDESFVESLRNNRFLSAHLL